MNRLKSADKFIIVSPSHIATGGTELLQQLCAQLQEFGCNAYMYYPEPYENSPVQQKFGSYGNPSVKYVEDVEKTILIVPETRIDMLYHFHKINKIIWWLSVDNYYGAFKETTCLFKKLYRKIKDIRNNEMFKQVFHLVQSEYAKKFLIEEKRIQYKNIAYLSDYLNESFVESAYSGTITKENIILYNPRKGYEFTKKIIEDVDEYQWLPLQNLTREQMIELLQRSKVYIDFGNHPGKDRIPREAAICGCCVITGKQGAANNNKDVPIGNKYKFDDNIGSIAAIHQAISECIEKYDDAILDFQQYRNIICNERARFKSDVKRLFVKN